MASDSFAWFEFLLNPTLLESHLNQSNPVCSGSGEILAKKFSIQLIKPQLKVITQVFQASSHWVLPYGIPQKREDPEDSEGTGVNPFLGSTRLQASPGTDMAAVTGGQSTQEGSDVEQPQKVKIFEIRRCDKYFIRGTATSHTSRNFTTSYACSVHKFFVEQKDSEGMTAGFPGGVGATAMRSVGRPPDLAENVGGGGPLIIGGGFLIYPDYSSIRLRLT
ncbi:hypothetical protein GWK47_043833 [Chionoecetes opilio]|uniref:Uncharacterized protein n=1 Tax=Chionoecetes opilio TaxID=41210 RepID=A0A8J4YFT5_CHIOP|nr:hypothetical protein GWK47_043833 [Chionoecetes opilio]